MCVRGVCVRGVYVWGGRKGEGKRRGRRNRGGVRYCTISRYKYKNSPEHFLELRVRSSLIEERENKCDGVGQK